MPTARTGPHNTTAAPGALEHALPPRARHAFLTAWFNQIGAASPAVRALGVGPDEAIGHILAAPLRTDPRRARFARFDLPGAAVARRAAEDDPRAWRIITEHAPLLARALAGFTETDSPALAARRFLDEIRTSTLSDADAPHNLRRYPADRPLRVWLADRLLGSSAARLRAPSGPAVSVRLRRALHQLERQRDHVRAAVGIHAEADVRRLLAERDE